MERVLIPTSDVASSVEDPRIRVRGLLARVAPLWRHAVWFFAFATVVSFAVAVRLDVQRMQKDLVRTQRTQREAMILQDRLRLELDARRRATAMEQLATRHRMVANPAVVHVGSP